MRTDERGAHHAVCMFCNEEWIVSKFVTEPYTCPLCRAKYKTFSFTTTKKRKRGNQNDQH